MSGFLPLISSAIAIGAAASGNAAVILGPVVFLDWEVPEKIPFGGAQSMHAHKMPGGARKIDAMGRDDMDIAWEGLFTDLGGYAKAQLLDVLRASGQTWTLAWDTFNYQVIIQKFEADFTRINWVPYRINCFVVQDRAAALISAGIGVLTSAVNDVGSALGFSGSL